MKFIDLLNPGRVSHKPDKVIPIFEDASFIEQGFEVNKVELCLYNEQTDDTLGVYSLITSIVYTNKGDIEMIYDEGFRGNDALERAAKFLSANLGVSSVIIRSIIALNQELANDSNT